MRGLPVRLRAAWILWAGAILAAGGCDNTSDVHPAGGRTAPPPPLVITAPATRREISPVVEALGTTHANESVTITAKLTDTVSQVRFEDGELVEKGAVLVELTNREQTALLAEAEANAEDARLQYQRLADLLTQRSVPVSQVDEARARLSAAQARYESILARLSDRLIRAPFAGLLGFRQVSAGTLVTPTTPITTLDDISLIKLDFTLPEVHLALVRPGLPVDARSVAFGDRVFHGDVHTVGSRVDPVSRAITVRAVLDNPDLTLRPGMLFTVLLRIQPHDAVTVPDLALVQEGDATYLYTVIDDRAVRRNVVIGQRREGWAEVKDGLEAGEEVVVDGQIKLRDGLPVRTQSPVPAAS
ncbi:MAG: efflux RND transporter periplasmic adaptor subunit [Pseudomonadales bacterium]|nr:efflux RND transporter periplasmic adaptor subunit [Pseudomonadales bacterium]